MWNYSHFGSIRKLVLDITNFSFWLLITTTVQKINDAQLHFYRRYIFTVLNSISLTSYVTCKITENPFNPFLCFDTNFYHHVCIIYLFMKKSEIACLTVWKLKHISQHEKSHVIECNSMCICNIYSTEK